MFEELKYWYLRDHKLFWTLSQSQIKQLCIITGFKKAKKGDVIYFAASDLPRVFLLKKGAIKIVSLDEEGNETIKDIIQKGDLFGELELDTDRKSNEYAKALTDEIIICSFLLSDFENLLLQHPNLALTYTKFVGLKMKRIKNSYANLMSKDAKTRLVTFFKEWADREGKKEDNRVYLENYLTQNDIAQIICTSRQTATSLLNELEDSGLLYYSRKQIIIEDLSKF
ncbi:CRP/FNR family transcriptional regulator, anaerobic regulatory protein [Flavobacterium fontis]|uniref:CRP/FNR family transcriptional regulator, anaerobic regulatory protein n=1 Tax=Flavobacterium fontis TaxID=1124188 RepID=A0A1M5D634_9FLAO|nr:Crp/Fnr family transcriptional regulator [Flavobacterium fontis]SHF62431.1 CRP/FNR family transcriptional regulator, anaerobic regulatory protein [Flavobacterium fontis]